MSLRPLNQQTSKSQFRACWHLQKTSLNSEPCWHLQKTGLETRWHLQKTSITNFWSLVASHAVMSLRPLNQQTAKSQFRALLTSTKDRPHLSILQGPVLKLGGSPTSYVIATSELTDCQVSAFNPAKDYSLKWHQYNLEPTIRKAEQFGDSIGSQNKRKNLHWFQKEWGYMEAHIQRPTDVHCMI